MSTLEALLRRERAFVAGALAVLMLLAWIYIWQGAGMGMSALEMTRLTLFPHTQTESMAESMTRMPMTASAGWATAALMWWVMMIAMMTPGAAPLVLMYGRVLRHASAQHRTNAVRERRLGGAPEKRGAPVYASTFFLTAGYLAVWLAFSAAAAALQHWLVGAGLLSAALLSSNSALLSAGVLLAAGVYQLSPLKHVCLRHCRNPVDFLTRHWRKGRSGALLLGLEHGAWCVGCCWMLMALLFAGGIMNLAWIALLALLVLVEKVAARGEAVGRVAGGTLIAWGAVTLAVATE